MQQMPDLYEGMGKNFVNNLFEQARHLGEGGMQNGSMEFEERIAILKLMGADTSLMEKANELNQATIEGIDASPPLLEMENETQERGQSWKMRWSGHFSSRDWREEDLNI